MTRASETKLEGEGPVTIALFDDRQQAEYALDDLLQEGFHHDHVGYMIRGHEAMRGGMIVDAQGAKDASGAVRGALAGAAIGGMLMAAAAFVLPGVGPVVAGGILAAFFGGAIAGTAIGGLFGAMQGLGASESEAKHYEREFNSGKAIVAVRAGDRAEEADAVLKRHGGYDIQRRNYPTMPAGLEGSTVHP